MKMENIAPKMKIPLPVTRALWVVLCFVVIARADIQCDDGKYHNEALDECVSCTSCPDNEIVRIPCTRKIDTICGPFNEFHSFKQPNTLAIVAEKQNNTSVTVKHRNQDVSQKSVTWYTITMVLVAALCVTGVFLVALATITCYVMRKRRKEVMLLGDRDTEVQPAPEASNSKMERFELIEET